MATRTNNNTHYYINPAYLTFVENSGYGANLIQVSASSSCYIRVFIPGVIKYDADGNYRRWKVTAYNNKFPDDTPAQRGKWFIYVRMEKEGTSALIIYDQVERGVHGAPMVEKTDDKGNVTKVEGEYDEEKFQYYYIHIGEVGPTSDAKTDIREISYDTGRLESDQVKTEGTQLNEMWELDKFTTPWLIKAKQWLADFTVKGFITLIGGLIFKKGQDGEGKAVSDIKRSFDDDNEFMVDEAQNLILDEEGKPIPNPGYVPISDETIPTTKWVSMQSSERYLKKYEPDETDFMIKFKGGLQAGEYVKGMIGGSGAEIDRDGYGEMTGLTLREFLEVPELRFNRIDVVSGELWNSIAFGLIESVDTDRQICTLKLEGNERAGLHIGDLCRGIFADFGDGEKQEEQEDDFGFVHLYGFRTSYFAPDAILENTEGRFVFRYVLGRGKSGSMSTVHPCASMKFAVYGNQQDASRRASAYSTRTYKRYLSGVDTWVVDPSRHIYAQYGCLDGLSIGGFEMEGYGSFQTNSYFTGLHIQFTPEQKEELKGQDAYSVVLSRYESFVVVDDEGNIVGGDIEALNVITDGENVVTEEQNVVTRGARLTTNIIAKRGASELIYSPTVAGVGTFTISMKAVGCEAAVVNGSVVITSILDLDYCMVEIDVNCEGVASYPGLRYMIHSVSDGKNPIVADLDNEMDSVACDEEGRVLFGLPINCNVSLSAGFKLLELRQLDIDAPQGVTATAVMDETTGFPTGEVVIPEGGIPDGDERVFRIRLTPYAWYGNVLYHKTVTFTVQKVVSGQNAVIYKLKTNVAQVVVDKEDKLSSDVVSCSLVGFDGKQSLEMGAIPDGYRMEYSVDESEFEVYEYRSDLAVTNENRQVSFRLLQEAGKDVPEDTVVDEETVYVLRDGIGVRNVIAYIRTNKTPAAPEGGSFEDPKPTSTPEWFLGDPGGEAILWGSFRTFTTNGLPPQDEWSKPCQLTDTASIKTVWSSLTEPSPLPKAPEINGDWTEDPTEESIWMAMTAKKNGEWSEWVVSQVKGESPIVLHLSSSTATRNTLGAADPESVILRAMKGRKTEDVYMRMFAFGMSDPDGTASAIPLNMTNYAQPAHQWSIDLRALSSSYKTIVFRAYEYDWRHSYEDEYIDEKALVFVDDGESGPMPRNMGEWNNYTEYLYTNEYRDFVFDSSGQVYIRKGKGAQCPAGTSVTNEDYWERASRQSLMAIDTALIDGANIGGFMIKGGRMVSQNAGEPNLVLDGGTGYFKCVDANIDGKLTARKMAYRTAVGAGSSSVVLDGHTMAVGPGSFELPSLTAGENIQIRAFNPSTLNGVNKPMTITSPYVGQPMRMYQEDLYGEGEGGFVNLWNVTINYDEMYTFTGVGGSFQIGGTSVSGYWMVSSSAGSASGAATKVITDGALDESSKNPVANWVIKTEFDKVRTELAEKIQIANTYNEAVQGEPGVLYLIR